MAETAKWYVVHTYSGYENTVKATIEKTVESRKLQDQILAVSIPLETVTEITETGASKTYDRKVYPGYVLVKMVYSDDTWHVIRNVRGVTGFVGTSSNDPTPLTDEEVYAMGVEKKEIIVNYSVGDTVRIMDGPLSSFTGTVESIDVDSNSVNVVVSMFGRETTVEFELDQVEVVSQYTHRAVLFGRNVGGALGPERNAQCASLPHLIQEVLFMAQQVTGIIKLQINAAKLTASPPVGPALGQHGVNIAAFIKEFNARTKDMEGYKIPVVITVYADRSFTFITKTPPTPMLIMKAIGLEKGSGVPNKTKVGTITKAQVAEIAKTKMPDLNATTLEAAESQVAGTCRSMGVTVVD